MSRLVVAPIVEGHGEVACIRGLLARTWREVLAGESLECLSPIRAKRNKIVQRKELDRLIGLAALKLTNVSSSDRKLIFLLIDADKDCPAALSHELWAMIREDHPHRDVACVIAKVEYETWFVAAAESLIDNLELRPADPPESPEDAAAGKDWISARFKGAKYSETIDQPRLTAKMDLHMCRRRSPSFDKLCRELQKHL